MPNQNQPDLNQNSTQEPTSPVNSYGSQVDLPPLPPDFQNVEAPPANPIPEAPKENMGSAAPPVPPVPNINSVASLPKKKYGTGKIIATILGLFLLIGGVGAGITLTQQKQLFQQKASGNCAGQSLHQQHEYLQRISLKAGG